MSGPSGPSSGPSAGNPGAGPATPGPRGGGIPIDFRRGKTAKRILTVDWTYPVFKVVQATAGSAAPQGTVAGPVERALPMEQAYEFISDGDPRPLLVMRECERCKGTDHALLSRSLDNEQTVLLTKWFHCVKLPTNVVMEKHPLYNLFLREKEGERIPHLFFADPNGANRAELPGDQSQTQLWNVMFSYLERCYAEDAKTALKELRQVLSQYDKLDGLEQEVRSRIERETVKNGPESAKLKKLDGDLAEIDKKRKDLAAREKELRDLALKTMQGAKPDPAKAGAPEPAGAGAGASAK